jgi:DNA-3-methyladenine glycosylase II
LSAAVPRRRPPRAQRIDVFDDVARPCAALARRDPALKAALAAIGRPHIRRRPGGFEGLFRIIVEQQVSVPSAQAIWGRCAARFAPMNAAAVAAAGEDGLRALGLSGPKARYVIALAETVACGALDFADLGPDGASAQRALETIRGVGPWTAAIYLLFCEGRVDIWPPGDVALQHAHGAASGRSGKTPGPELDARAETWSPYRGVAAHILWTYYAHLRGRRPI